MRIRRLSAAVALAASVSLHAWAQAPAPASTEAPAPQPAPAAAAAPAEAAPDAEAAKPEAPPPPAPPKPPPPPAKADVSFALLGVPGPGWAKKIYQSMEGAPGVDGVEVDTSQRTAVVHFRTAQARPQGLLATAREKSGLDLKLVRHATFWVKGELTPNCPVLVRMALQRMDGVKGIRASVDQARAWVDYTEGVAAPPQMVALVKDRTGLDMELVSDQF